MRWCQLVGQFLDQIIICFALLFLVIANKPTVAIVLLLCWLSQGLFINDNTRQCIVGGGLSVCTVMTSWVHFQPFIGYPPFLMLCQAHPTQIKKKSRTREAKNLSTDADNSTAAKKLLIILFLPLPAAAKGFLASFFFAPHCRCVAAKGILGKKKLAKKMAKKNPLKKQDQKTISFASLGGSGHFLVRCKYTLNPVPVNPDFQSIGPLGRCFL